MTTMKTLAMTGGCCGPRAAPRAADFPGPDQIRTEHDLVRGRQELARK
jgi:hypothetical protein